jgi:hypothetical protein
MSDRLAEHWPPEQSSAVATRVVLRNTSTLPAPPLQASRSRVLPFTVPASTKAGLAGAVAWWGLRLRTALNTVFSAVLPAEPPRPVLMTLAPAA